MSEPIAYLKGQFVPQSQCVLPISDMGIVMGAAVTDQLRTFDQRPYRMEDHVRRFYRSCKYARIEPPVDIDESMSITKKLIAKNSKTVPNEELAVVYYMTAGEIAHYAGKADMSGKPTPSYVQHTFPMPFYLWREDFLNGAHCVTPSARHWPPQCLSAKIKNRNRLHMWIGQQEAYQFDPKAKPLFLDTDGNITETSGSNFVIYHDGQVVSPRRNNILWGISLTVVTEILADMGVPFIEADIQTYDVVNADEAWMPSSPYCLGPVVRINGMPIGDGKPGPMWRRLLDQWSKIVGKDIYRQVIDTEPHE